MRSQDEIVARIRAGEKDRFFGWDLEVLLPCLDFEHARPLLKPDVTAEKWSGVPKSDDSLREEAVKYLDFAWGKAEDHRGISASRSVEKMTEYLWLLGMNQAVADMAAAGYAQYGAPKLRVAAEALGQPLPESEALKRMMQGEHCTPGGCESGCGE